MYPVDSIKVRVERELHCALKLSHSTDADASVLIVTFCSL
jgi:hypothetical protein